jgi:hypothetical protein
MYDTSPPRSDAQWLLIMCKLVRKGRPGVLVSRTHFEIIMAERNTVQNTGSSDFRLSAFLTTKVSVLMGRTNKSMMTHIERTFFTASTGAGVKCFKGMTR